MRVLFGPRASLYHSWCPSENLLDFPQQNKKACLYNNFEEVFYVNFAIFLSNRDVFYKRSRDTFEKIKRIRVGDTHRSPRDAFFKMPAADQNLWQ